MVHLNRALTSGQNVLPTTARADLLDVLARCRHQVALHHDQEEEERERTQARTKPSIRPEPQSGSWPAASC